MAQDACGKNGSKRGKDRGLTSHYPHAIIRAKRPKGDGIVKKIDVIFFCGQSNMQGQTEMLTETAPVVGAYEYKWLTGEAVALANPVGENVRYDGTAGYTYVDGVDQAAWLSDHVLGGACYGHTNLVPAFCRAYIEKTGKTVLAVHMAKGSTEVDNWLPGTDGYAALLGKGRTALDFIAAEYEVEHVLLAWLQGESDAVFKKSKAYYKEKLALLAASLREELGVERFGVIRVGRFTGDARDDEIIDAQCELCRENPDFLMLTEMTEELCREPAYMNPFVGGHYGARGLERLGAAAGAALGAYRVTLE